MSITTKLTSARRATVVTAGAFATALVLAACGGGNDTPEGAVENFFDNGVEEVFNAMAEGDFAAAAENGEEYLCADDVAGIEEMGTMFEGMSEDEVSEATGDYALPEEWSYEIGEVSEDGDTATVEVEMTEGDEEPSSESFDLVKEDDAWKLCGTFS